MYEAIHRCGLVNHTRMFYQIRAPLDLVIANQPSHYVSICDFPIPGPILYLNMGDPHFIQNQ